MIRTKLNGKAEIIAADCNAFSPVSPPAASKVNAIADSDRPEITFVLPDGFKLPREVCIARTKVAESADVIKNIDTSKIATIDRMVPNVTVENTSHSCTSV